MWISRMAALIVLFILAFIDIRRREIPVSILIAANISVLIYYFINKEMNIYLIIGGAGVGFFFLGISKVTREGIGWGDSWGILILGMYLGLWKLLIVLTAAFFFLAVFAAAMLYRKKMSRRCRLPFFPFLTAGYLTLLAEEGGIL